jgi:hypothetical protein
VQIISILMFWIRIIPTKPNGIEFSKIHVDHSWSVQVQVCIK